MCSEVRHSVLFGHIFGNSLDAVESWGAVGAASVTYSCGWQRQLDEVAMRRCAWLCMTRSVLMIMCMAGLAAAFTILNAAAAALCVYLSKAIRHLMCIMLDAHGDLANALRTLWKCCPTRLVVCRTFPTAAGHALQQYVQDCIPGGMTHLVMMVMMLDHAYLMPQGGFATWLVRHATQNCVWEQLVKQKEAICSPSADDEV